MYLYCLVSRSFLFFQWEHILVTCFWSTTVHFGPQFVVIRQLCRSQQTGKLKEMEIPDHLTCLLRNLYECQEAAVTMGHRTMDFLKIGKEVRQGCISSSCLFNLCAEYMMCNAGLDESQFGIKIARRNINNPTYADDTTLMAESKEELKSLLMKMKEESEKAGLKLNIQKTTIMASGPITSWQIEGGKNGNSGRFYFLGLQNHCRWWLQSWN